MEDMHCNVAFFNMSHGTFYLFVECMHKVGECHDEVPNGVIIA